MPHVACFNNWNSMDLVDEESCIFTKSFFKDFESIKNNLPCQQYSARCNCNPHTSLNFNTVCLLCQLRLKDRSKLDDHYWSFLTEETSKECNQHFQSLKKFSNDRQKDYLFCLEDTKNSSPQSSTHTIFDIKPSQTAIENGQMAANSLENQLKFESRDNLTAHQSEVQSPIGSDDDRFSDVSKDTILYNSDDNDQEMPFPQQDSSLLSESLVKSIGVDLVEKSEPAQVQMGTQTNSKSEISSFPDLEKKSKSEVSNLNDKRISEKSLQSNIQSSQNTSKNVHENICMYKVSNLKYKIRKISVSDESPKISKVTDSNDTNLPSLLHSSRKISNSNESASQPFKAVPPNPSNSPNEIEYIGSEFMSKETQSIREHAKIILIEFVGHYKMKTIYDDFIQLCHDRDIPDIEEEHTLPALDRNIRRFITQFFIRKHLSLPQKVPTIRTDISLDEYFSTLEIWHQKLGTEKS